MKRIFTFFIFIILFLVNTVYAQSIYKIELNGGRITSSWENKLLPNWDTGWSFGITASKQIKSEIELISSFSFQNFKFQSDRVQFPPTLAILGYFQKVSYGENSNVYNFSFGVKLLSPANKISTFISFSGGIQYINQGKIFITGGSSLSNSKTYLYNSNDRNYIMGFVSIGTGLSFRLMSKINLTAEGKIISTLKEFTTYPNISTGIQYSF